MISLKQISRSYDGQSTWAVRDVTCEIATGELVVLLGESGCGKTTTLKMINRLIALSSGSIAIEERDIMQTDAVTLRRKIGYVFQEIGLFPHMTISENVGVVPKLLGWSQSEVSDRVDELMHLVGLTPTEYGARYPRELSGGQQQRVGVARALAARPKLMLMDEPFGALDPITRAELSDEFRKLQRELKLTVVMVTHDMTEALTLADRIAVMKQGRILAMGTPQQLLASGHDPYVEKLLDTPRRQAERLAAIITKDPKA
ncbi:MAG: ATP-binding cassette domain-containing protein [candidate division Zixibacteria bacterium]|nr:ATP-binding cassette domain-containing protein [candidate division Zixibacteria bacterium]MDH3935912.1 ATP-binding cassette domain-containing protein [candidate division Zixibacteria bacterium]MDH4032821.1 ATP-binding cassette domain-containing protein [candidate division Zixibacteria bacterium]